MFMCGAATFPVVLCMQTPAMGGTHISHASVVNARAPHAFRMRVLPESTIDATHDAFVGLLRSKRLLLQLHNQDAERSIAFIANTLGDIAQGNVTRSRHPIQTVLDGTLAGDAHWDPLWWVRSFVLRYPIPQLPCLATPATPATPMSDESTPHDPFPSFARQPLQHENTRVRVRGRGA